MDSNGDGCADLSKFATIPSTFWFVVATMTTVGYGDYVPVTQWGRFFAVLIMLVGISVLGAVTATLSATLVKQKAPGSSDANAPAATSAAPDDSDAMTNDELRRELAEIKSMLAALQASVAGGAPPSATS